MDPFYSIDGVNVGVFNDTTLVIEPFSMWMWGPSTTPGWGGQIVNFTSTIYLDIRAVGINGIDVNPNGAGNVPPDWAYNIIALFNPTTGVLGFMLTKHGESMSNMIVPSGFTFYRKLMYGVAVYGGKLLPNHTSNWPMPTVEFTGQIQIGPAFTSAVTDYPVDVAKLIPENSRMGIFRAVITGSGNNLWLSPSGSQYRKLWCYNGAGVIPGIRSRVQYTYGNPNTSMIYVTFQPGASGRLDLYLDGFSMTEVT